MNLTWGLMERLDHLWVYIYTLIQVGERGWGGHEKELNTRAGDVATMLNLESNGVPHVQGARGRRMGRVGERGHYWAARGLTASLSTPLPRDKYILLFDQVLDTLCLPFPPFFPLLFWGCPFSAHLLFSGLEFPGPPLHLALLPRSGGMQVKGTTYRVFFHSYAE